MTADCLVDFFGADKVLPEITDGDAFEFFDWLLRDTLIRAIEDAGLNVWPNLWRSLRSTRQTELEDQGIPTHVVCYWLGNLPKVAQKHYLKVHEEHYAKAVHHVA